MANDYFICTYCGVKGDEHTLTIDHITPRSRGGDNADHNLTTSCIGCNSKKTDSEVSNFIDRYRLDNTLSDKLRSKIDLLRSLNGAKDKDKDKDKDMDKDMDKEIKKGQEKTKKTKKVKVTDPESHSILEALLPNEVEIMAWLRTGSKKLQEKLFSTYDHEYLRATIEKAYYWQLENKKREAGSYLSSWIERDTGKKFKGNLNSGDYALKNFFDSAIIAGGLTIPGQGIK